MTIKICDEHKNKHVFKTLITMEMIFINTYHPYIYDYSKKIDVIYSRVFDSRYSILTQSLFFLYIYIYIDIYKFV